MSAISPVVLTHLFAEDPDAAGMVDLAELDEQLDLLAEAHQAHNDLFASLMRGDLTLKDSLIRSRNLHPEVVGLLQLVAQSTAGGLHILPACRVASTGNLTLSAPQTIDGIAVIANDLVLVKDQTDPSENGLYQVNAGAWTRVVTAASWDDLTSGFVWVDNGTANRLSAWAVDIDAGGTIDIDPVAFQLVYRAAPLLADLDPSLVSTAVPTLLDYVLIHDVSAGGVMRRALMSLLPFLPSTTTHGDLVGLLDDDHPQYLLKAGGTMTGPIAMGDQRITGLPAQSDADANGDAASIAFVKAKAAAVSARRPGDVFVHAGAVVPSDAYLCNGDLLVRADEPALFAAIGELWGAGDGVTTFQIPDARGKVVIGAGTGAGLTARAVGDSGGEEEHTLVLNEIPAHHHTSIKVDGTGTGLDTPGSFGPTANNTGDSGGGLAHNNMPPFLAMLVCIQA